MTEQQQLNTAIFHLNGGFGIDLSDDHEGLNGSKTLPLTTLAEALQEWLARCHDTFYPTWAEGINLSEDSIIIWADECDIYDAWTLEEAIRDLHLLKYIIQGDGGNFQELLEGAVEMCIEETGNA